MKDTNIAVMLGQLREYYEAQGISALGFCCKHQTACKTQSPRFTAAQETYVGPDYGNTVPRLVIMSLDSGSLDADPTTRTMDAVRRRVLAGDVHRLRKVNHWYQTHRLALTLLQPFLPALRVERVSRYFAHVNSAKCCQNNPENQQAHRLLFENCREYIGPEIRILRPDILVTQGKEARHAVEQHFADIDGGESMSDDEVCRYHIIETAPNNRTVWFATHHPHNPRFWAQSRECWPLYAKAAVSVMNGRAVEWSGAATELRTLATQQPASVVRAATTRVSSQEQRGMSSSPSPYFNEPARLGREAIRKAGEAVDGVPMSGPDAIRAAVPIARRAADSVKSASESSRWDMGRYTGMRVAKYQNWLGRSAPDMRPTALTTS